MQKNVLVESQMIPIKALEEGMNLAESLIDTVVFYIIDHIIDDQSLLKLDLEKIIGFGSIGGTILISKLLEAKRANAITMMRAYGFNMGLLIGATTMMYFSSRALPQIKPGKGLIKLGARLGYLFMKNKINLVNKVSSKLNPILSKIFKIPSYEKHLEAIVNDNKSLDGKEVVNAFFKSYLFGVVIGIIGFTLYIKKTDQKYFTDLFSFVESSPKIDSNTKNFLLFGLSAVSTSNAIIASLENTIGKSKISSSKKTDEKFLNIIEKIAFGITYPKGQSKKLIKLYSKKHLNPIDTQHSGIPNKLELAIDRLFSAINIVMNKDPNFKKFIDTVYVKLGNYDNAHVTFSKTRKGKFDITFVFNSKVKSRWIDFTIEEFAAVIFHELGHVVTGAFYVMPIEFVSSLFIDIASSLLGSYGRDLIIFSQMYNMVNVARIAEMQADAYAIRKGFGDSLASALSKLTLASKELDDIVLMSSHGSNLSRIDTIGKKYNSVVQEIKKL